MPYEFSEYTPYSPDIDFQDIFEYPLSQYLNSTRLNRLSRGLVDLYKSRVGDYLFTMDRNMNPRQSEGVALDWIGLRLGIVRPRVPDANAEFWGLEGTRRAGGRPLSQAPFYTEIEAFRAQTPVADETYRCILFARARRLHGDIGNEAWTDCLNALLEGGGSGSIKTIGTRAVTVTYTDISPDIQQILGTDFHTHILPVIPGINYTFTFI